MYYYVYLIEQYTTGYIKVGATKNPEKRLATLQTSNPHRLVLRCLIECFTWEDALKLESTILKLYAPFQIRYPLGVCNEWFKMDIEQAVRDFSLLVNSYGLITGGTLYDKPKIPRNRKKNLKRFLWKIDECIVCYLRRIEDKILWFIYWYAVVTEVRKSQE